jgi:hypothetical protein
MSNTLAFAQVQINSPASKFDSYGFTDSKKREILRLNLLHQDKNGTNVQYFSDIRKPSTTPSYVTVDLASDKKSYVMTLYGNNGVPLELIQYETKKSSNYYKVIKDRRDDAAIKNNSNVFNDVENSNLAIDRPENSAGVQNSGIEGEEYPEEPSVFDVLGSIISLDPFSAVASGQAAYEAAEQSAILKPIIDDVEEFVEDIVVESLQPILSLEEPFYQLEDAIIDVGKEIAKITEETFDITKDLLTDGFDLIKWIIDHGWLFLILFVLILILAILIGLKNLL